MSSYEEVEMDERDARRSSREEIQYAKERARFHRVLRQRAHQALVPLEQAMKEIRKKPENAYTSEGDFLRTLWLQIEEAYNALKFCDDFYTKDVGTTLKPRPLSPSKGNQQKR